MLLVASQYPQVEDFVAKSGNDPGDYIVLHLNIYKMLLQESSGHAVSDRTGLAAAVPANEVT